MKIKSIHARQILDSRANPTLEAEVVVEHNGASFMGRAAVPSGASTGTNEALELRDGGDHYLGQGVMQAVANVKTKISDLLVDKIDLAQADLDKLMIDLDGTETKSNLGANAILGVSLAYAWAVSKAQGRELYEYIGELYGNRDYKLPRPMLNIMNGGKHANWATDIQEYMVIPMHAANWEETMKIASEVFNHLHKILKEKKLSTNVGNEGGFAPDIASNQMALDILVEAIEKAGYKLGDDIRFGFDAAASEFYNPEQAKYQLKRDNLELTTSEMVEWVVGLSNKYPVESFEDMLAESDWQGWTELTAKVGDKIQIVGDDLLVTNVKFIEKAIELKAANALLVKVNQIGSLTEALAAMKLAQSNNWGNVVSHRSGETEDVTIAHIAVGTGCGQLKTGAPSRGERTAKYNELTRIAEKIER